MFKGLSRDSLGSQGRRRCLVRGCPSEISDESVVYKTIVPIDVLLSLLFDGEHGHGFMLATSINEAGYSVEYFALEIEIILSSNGCLITSKTERLNSGSSSKRKNLCHCNNSLASLSMFTNELLFHAKMWAAVILCKGLFCYVIGI